MTISRRACVKANHSITERRAEERILPMARDTLTDDDGNHVDMLTVGSWYLNNIHKPEASHEDQFVREGMLATANDSGFNQSYEAFQMAYDIIEQGLNPAHMRTKTPARRPRRAPPGSPAPAAAPGPGSIYRSTAATIRRM